MKRCDECSVLVNTPVIHCPLCYSFLQQEDNKPEPITYPNLLAKAETYNILFRLLLFISLTAIAVSVTVNALTFQKYYWSLVVVGAIFYGWIAIGTAFRGRKKLGFNVMIQVVSIAALIVILSLVFGFRQPVFNYVLPAIFVSATLSITIIVIVRHMDVQSFILYFILIALLGFVPLLLVLFKLTTVNWPAIASALYSGLSLISLFIFADTDTKKELRKRFTL